MKRKLVRSFGSDADELKALPQHYIHVKQRWVCDVSVENGEGVVDEYEIKPTRKLYLDDFLDIVSTEIQQFNDGCGIAWRADIYRLTCGR